MIKLITICFLLNISFAVKAQDREHKSYHDNGQLKSIRKITNGKANGECKFYFENGQLNQIGNYIDDKQNGEWKYYYENGKLKSIGKLIDNKQNGEWKYYHENGQLKNIGKLIDNKQNGEWKEYFENGQLKNIGKLIDNKFTGEWIYNHENGELRANRLFDVNGNEIEIKKASIEIKANNDLSNYRPVTIPQLKALIGYNKSEVKKILKKKDYFLDEEENDNKDGHPHEYYTNIDYDTEIEIIYINKVSRVAGFEGISNDEYKTLVESLKANKFYLKTKGNIGTERNDIWEDKNEDWRMVVYYRTWPEFKILRVTLYEVK